MHYQPQNEQQPQVKYMQATDPAMVPATAAAYLMMKGSTGSYNAIKDKTAARRGPKALFMVKYCICMVHTETDTESLLVSSPHTTMLVRLDMHQAKASAHLVAPNIAVIVRVLLAQCLTGQRLTTGAASLPTRGSCRHMYKPADSMSMSTACMKSTIT